MYSVQCTVYRDSLQCTVYSVQWKLYIVHCTVYSVLHRVHNVQWTQYSLQSKVDSAVYSVKCTVNSVLCTLYGEYDTMYRIWYILVFQYYQEIELDFRLYQKICKKKKISFFNENRMTIWFNIVYLWVLGNCLQTWPVEIFSSGRKTGYFWICFSIL